MGRKKASRPKVDIHRSKRKSWVDRYKWVLAAAVILVGVVYWHGHYWIGAEPGSGNKPKFTTRKKTEKTRAFVSSPRITETIPHDPTCYTQGLIFHDGLLYETCGMYGESRIQVIDPKTGEIKSKQNLPSNVFAEGVEVVGNRLHVLTWRERQLLVYDVNTLEYVETYSFQTTTGEGWGISSNGSLLVVTDGSSNLHFWDAKTLKPLSKISVKDQNGKDINYLNEIEFVNDYELLANVYFQELIVRIDIRTGKPLGW
mmetsp:Transcript_1722/g.2741  ORF Transcript_1722/g.2741 Transcript_1722/m.2741 type:complete len:257 (+) Transcript_1722:1042-1812(+)